MHMSAREVVFLEVRGAGVLEVGKAARVVAICVAAAHTRQ